MSEPAKKVPVSAVPGQPAKAGGQGANPFHPWQPFESLRRQIDNLFDDFGRTPLRLPFGHSALDVEPFWRREPFGHGMPAVDVSEQADAFRINAELPGMDEKDIEIKLANGNLIIKGEKKEEKDETRKEYHVCERRYGSFERVFRVPREVDPDKIQARFSKGVLQVQLPKRAEAVHPEKVIPVEAAK
ncbi:Hsp20/alpha crystallin family protein [Pseudomonas citronellolis]|uniref:Hsp20/alpha crystallin family protein n=1 Tax=Pseudomonas citronellolis TaxID=53408 RepID=UPI0023E41774|nr:Hsp20/alpha crystallin family protein [Pseudomonas citronellolis]MDF3933677.1 Hsp20/alpha crystallin family protein [Pseudomonas citronellolis]